MSITYKIFDSTKSFEIKTCKAEIHSTKKHLHSTFSIGIVDQGKTNIQVNNIRYGVSKKQLLLIPAYVLHECKPINIQEWECRIIYLNNNYNHLINDICEEIVLCKLSDIQYNEFNKYIESINSDNCDFDMKIRDFINYIKSLKKDISIEINKNNKIANDIKKYIECNYLKKITLENLEHYFSINRYSIIKLFNANYNMCDSHTSFQFRYH